MNGDKSEQASTIIPFKGVIMACMVCYEAVCTCRFKAPAFGYRNREESRKNLRRKDLLDWTLKPGVGKGRDGLTEKRAWDLFYKGKFQVQLPDRRDVTRYIKERRC